MLSVVGRSGRWLHVATADLPSDRNGWVDGSQPGLAMHSRMARTAGLGLDEVELAREFDSGDERQAALLRYLKAVVEEQGRAPLHLHEEAREAGWTDEQILEALAYVSLETFTATINVAGDVPVDGSVEESRTATLRAA